MKSLCGRLTAWFAISLLAVVAILMAFAHWHLDYELRQEKWARSNQAKPDWVLHGSFTDQEVSDILGELMQSWLMVGIPLVGIAILLAYFLAKQSTRPVRELNRQLARLGPATLGNRLRVPDADPEVAELVRHSNDLLGRLESSFHQLHEYTTQVAHELRTPLQLMRLKIEAQAASMAPELAEDLAEELARLSNYVETALTIARAEQGRLEIRPTAFPLRPFLADMLEPFSRLAAAEHRRLFWACAPSTEVWTDRGALKQILFNLLNNALKHGSGDILLRAHGERRGVSLLVGNRSADRGGNRDPGLGIGLRLVRALAHQLDQTQLAIRRGTHFWVRLRLPTAPGRVTDPVASPEALATAECREA